jgi:molybdopterin-guanine dinucleotide biosynthesis protein A
MIDRQRMVGVILAGGQSSRMGGRDKGRLELGGKTLIGRVRDRLEPQCVSVVLNANGDPARFAEFGMPVVPDSVPGFAGPLAGILAAMTWASRQRPRTSHVLTVACDTPFFPRDLGKRLAQALAGSAAPIAIAASAGARHPVFGLWPVDLAGGLAAFLASGEGGKVMRFAERHGVVEADFPFAGDADPFFNINTPEDFDIARRRASQSG